MIGVLLLILSCYMRAQKKIAKIDGEYTGKFPQRLGYYTHKPTYQPTNTVNLTLKKNHKCVFKSQPWNNYGTWSLKSDTLICIFTKEKRAFEKRKTKLDSSATQKYYVQDDGCLYPVNGKIRFCKRTKDE